MFDRIHFSARGRLALSCVALLALCGLALTACGDDEAAPAPAPAPPPAPPPAPEPEPEPEPPPPPPPAEPFLVSIVPPASDDDDDCMGQVLCPDDGTDPTKAMAMVNPMAMVNSSHAGRITPMFVEGAPAAAIMSGANTPFEFTTWSILQADALMDGATFAVTRVEAAGAGQEPMPVGDMMYITCNPFACSEAMAMAPAAPELKDSAICDDVEVDFRLAMGAVHNAANDLGEETDPDDEEDAGTRAARRGGLGVDLGWTYTSNVDGSVEHVFGSSKVPGSKVTATSSPMALTMAKDEKAKINFFGPGGVDEDGRVVDVAKALEGIDAGNAKKNLGSARTTEGPIRNGALDCLPTLDLPVLVDDLEYSYEELLYSKGRASGGRATAKPDECFRLITNGYGDSKNPGNETRRFDYLPDYELHFTPDAGLTWEGSKLEWAAGKDPLAKIKCPATAFAAADQVDLCSAFQDEAAAYWGKGLEGDFSWFPITEHKAEVDHDGNSATDKVPMDRLVRIEIRRKEFVAPDSSVEPSGPKWMIRAPGSRFTSMWLSYRGDSGDAATHQLSSNESDAKGMDGIHGNLMDVDLYRWGGSSTGTPAAAYDATADPKVDDFAGGFSPLEGASVRPVRIRPRVLLAFDIEDSDGDPMFGDLGKQDVGKRAETGGALDGKPDGNADNYPETNSDAYECSDSDGKGCDADDVELEGEIEFVMYQDRPDVCSWTESVSLTCSWDANGAADGKLVSWRVDADAAACDDPSADSGGSCNGDRAKGVATATGAVIGVSSFLTCTVN